MNIIVRKLNEAKADGIDTVVDATTLDLGRDVHEPMVVAADQVQVQGVVVGLLRRY